MRIVKVFWSLDASLAYRRHFPAINWLNSYSLYLDSLTPWFDENLGEDFIQNRNQRHAPFCRRRTSLNEIVQLVGKDSLVRQRPADAGDRPDAPGGLPAAERLYGRGLLLRAMTGRCSCWGMILHYESLCRGRHGQGRVPCTTLFAIPAREKHGPGQVALPQRNTPPTTPAVRTDMEQRDRRADPQRQVKRNDEGIPYHPGDRPAP